MNEKIYKSIENVLAEAEEGESMAVLLNRIADDCGVSISFKDMTRIKKLIEPQVQQRNVLKALVSNKQKEG